MRLFIAKRRCITREKNYIPNTVSNGAAGLFIDLYNARYIANIFKYYNFNAVYRDRRRCCYLGLSMFPELLPAISSIRNIGVYSTPVFCGASFRCCDKLKWRQNDQIIRPCSPQQHNDRTIANARIRNIVSSDGRYLHG